MKEQTDVSLLKKGRFLNYLHVLIKLYSQILEHPREGPGKLHVLPSLALLNLSNNYLLLLENRHGVLAAFQRACRVSNLLVPLGHTVKTLQHLITKKSPNVLSKFTILCWASFIAILGWAVYGLQAEQPCED